VGGAPTLAKRGARGERGGPRWQRGGYPKGTQLEGTGASWPSGIHEEPEAEWRDPRRRKEEDREEGRRSAECCRGSAVSPLGAPPSQSLGCALARESAHVYASLGSPKVWGRRLFKNRQ